MIVLNDVVYNKLKEIEEMGIVKSVLFSYPETFGKLPCITFYEINNKPCDFADNKEIASEINFVIDIWANSYEEIANITQHVVDKMAKIDFMREVAYDVPGSEVKHKFIRFKKYNYEWRN